MQKIKRYITASCAFILLAFTCMALPQRPSPQRLVNDFAGLFPASQASRLERALVAFDDSTSNQITVVTVDDLEGYTPSEYATRLGLEWQVGSSEFDNGVVVLVKPKTASGKGEVAIAVGYGLEGAIPDAYAKRIIENEMIPHFRNEDYFSGVASACQVLMQLASGEISEPRGKKDDKGRLPVSILIFIVVSGLFSFIWMGTGNNNGGRHGGNGNRGGLDADDLASAIIIGNILGGSSRGGRSSGGWGGSGGFGGSFGGFGGGSFGGGGASGSW